MSVKLSITNPSDDNLIIEHRRHFAVTGSIEGSIADDVVLRVSIYDSNGNLLRYAVADRKNNKNVYKDYPKLTTYPKEIDPDKEELIMFGFPELIVLDVDNPEDSFCNATIKCWYSDSEFKAIIITATDKEHGLVFDDGVGFVDENGNPYEVLKEGQYEIVVTIADNDGNHIADTSKKITIGHYQNTSIVRFNPQKHKENMIKWCKDNNIHILNDLVPGYLDSYHNNLWLYHKGILPMYLASDVTQYVSSKANMFVYMMEKDSTSYSVELAYLQKNGVVMDENRLAVYYYNCGEAVLFEGKSNEITGNIVKFDNEKHLAICRVDVVNSLVENEFYLDCRHVVSTITDINNVNVNTGETFAIMGVIRPWQMRQNDYVLREDNVYNIYNYVSEVVYEFYDGNNAWKDIRKPGLKRIDSNYTGTSVLEFYNVFSFGRELAGKTVTVMVTARDNYGNICNDKEVFSIFVKE